MSLRDTLLQLGYVLMALGAVFATWALLTGPLGRLTGLRDDGERAEPAADGTPQDGSTPAPADDQRSGSSEEPT